MALRHGLFYRRVCRCRGRRNGLGCGLYFGAGVVNKITPTILVSKTTTQHVPSAYIQRLQRQSPHLLRAERIQLQRMGFETPEHDIEIERQRALSLGAPARLVAVTAEIIAEWRGRR